MVPEGNALGVLSSPPQADHMPPLKNSGIKNRCNAVDGTFYDAINIGKATMLHKEECT